jgi:hypothetical protein
MHKDVRANVESKSDGHQMHNHEDFAGADYGSTSADAPWTIGQRQLDAIDANSSLGLRTSRMSIRWLRCRKRCCSIIC